MKVESSFICGFCCFVGSVFLQEVMLVRTRDKITPARAFLIIGLIVMMCEEVFRAMRESFCVGRMIV